MAKRNKVEIRRWMFGRVRVKDIKKALKCHHSLVSNTISGHEDNRRVLGYLLEKGCPAEWLALPADMQKKEAA